MSVTYPIDLTTGAIATIEGALFDTMSSSATGTGTVHPFLRLQDSEQPRDGVEEAANNAPSLGGQLDAKFSTKWLSLLSLSSLAVVILPDDPLTPHNEAGQYFKFVLDVGEPGPSSLITLDEVRIFVSDQPDLYYDGVWHDASAGSVVDPTLVYDMDKTADASVLIDSKLFSGGNGKADLSLFVPVFSGGQYVYFYTKLSGAEGSFEEWGAILKANAGDVTLSGYKWEDTDGNGAWDAGEAGLAGWRINVDYTGDGVEDAYAVTDETGKYTLVIPGAQIGSTIGIWESQQDGWTVTSNSDDASNPTTFVLTSGGAAGTSGAAGPMNFGNFQLGSLSGYKYEDMNGNGVKDAEDHVLAGWTIQLFKDGLDTGLTAVTDENGLYSFGDLGPGMYTTAEVMQSGWYQTAASGAETITSGENDTEGNDFLNTRYGKLVVEKYKDLNGDGDLKDPGENVLFAGFTFKLTDLTTGTAVTVADGGAGDADMAKNGKVVFEGLLVGHEYKVEEVLPAGSPYFVTYVDNGCFIIDSSGEVEKAVFGNGRYEGLTLGYWSNKGLKSNDWDQYKPTDKFEQVFGVDLPTFKSGSKQITDAATANLTLLDALQTGGGDIAALLRQSTAALLNSVDEDVTYFYTKAQVIALVQDVFTAGGSYGLGDVETVKNLFAAQNELELFA